MLGYRGAGFLRDYLSEVDHRDHLMLLAYLQEEMGVPSRADWYVMLLSHDVKRGPVKHPDKVRIEHSRLKFKAADQPKSEARKRLETQMSKAMWAGRLGISIPLGDGADGEWLDPVSAAEQAEVDPTQQRWDAAFRKMQAGEAQSEERMDPEGYRPPGG